MIMLIWSIRLFQLHMAIMTIMTMAYEKFKVLYEKNAKSNFMCFAIIMPYEIFTLIPLLHC